MATKTNRTESIKLRVSPAEKALIQERAGGARKTSDYLRRLGLGGAVVHPAPEDLEPGPDHARRVNKAALRMPRKTAERVVSREEAKERAKEALGS